MKGQAAKYTFTVKEHGDGQPWIAIEPLRDSIEIFREGILALNLREGISLNEAQNIAKFLNNNVEFLSYSPLRIID